MDHTSIPTCALYRNTGTVIVRLKMEVTTSCCKREVYPVSGCPEVLNRPSGCEQCSRTRLISQYSDCDRSVGEKCRPHRSSTARSRYVNVCATVCLLLLVGCLSPRSTAAPHRRRATMERQRRATNEENALWANPCDFSDSGVTTRGTTTTYSPIYKTASLLAKQARYAYNHAYNYSDKFALLHSYDNFTGQLLKNWETTDWLRKTHPDALPKEKVFNQKMPDEYIESIIANIDQKLPTMYMGLKMIVAGLYRFSEEGLNSNVANDDILRRNVTETMHDVRAVLCYFNEIMIARKLEIQPLLDKDIPNFNNDISMGLVLYRDTLNYMDYLEQVFSKLAGMGSEVTEATS